MALFTLTAGLIGWLWGAAVADNSSLTAWQIARHSLGVRDLPRFVTVAYIHYGTYSGAALGIFFAILYIRHARRLFLLAATRQPNTAQGTALGTRHASNIQP